ncbi:hypothetical protein ACFV19_24715 [Streptomyces griseoluteus]|uniref:hypothetical protein n=1 Tax=Streptomyces griseoluteus TaxID=29306 RepID=UPI0036A7A023
MDERVFSPYYGLPPEQRTTTTRTESAFHQPVRPSWLSVRERLLSGRKRSKDRPANRV